MRTQFRPTLFPTCNVAYMRKKLRVYTFAYILQYFVYFVYNCVTKIIFLNKINLLNFLLSYITLPVFLRDIMQHSYIFINNVL